MSRRAEMDGWGTERLGKQAGQQLKVSVLEAVIAS